MRKLTEEDIRRFHPAAMRFRRHWAANGSISSYQADHAAACPRLSAAAHSPQPAPDPAPQA